MLVRSFGPSLARALTKSVQFVTQNCKINNFFVNRQQNFDVPEVPLSGSKFTKMLISQLWLATGCLNCTIRRNLSLRARKCAKLGAGIPLRYRTGLN